MLTMTIEEMVTECEYTCETENPDGETQKLELRVDLASKKLTCSRLSVTN